MSGPNRRDGAFARGLSAKSEQGRRTVADWEGFDVEGRLGVGSTGTVWLARQVSVGRLVALKELAPELVGNQAVREHLRHEAQVLARLDDPNCVAVYSYLETASSAAIVMEYVEGVSLRTLTGQGPLSVEQALSVLEGALSGLAAAHQQGIVHGDIKPENILLSTTGESKLVDFGLAATVGTQRAPGTGSPTYSSPEAAAGEPLGVASDLYSAGLVLSELLAGVTPVGADPAAAANSVPAPVASLVRRALDPDPSGRPESARAFLDELRAAAEEGCGDDWRRRALLVPLVVAAATGGGQRDRGGQGRCRLAAWRELERRGRCAAHLQTRTPLARPPVGGDGNGGDRRRCRCRRRGGRRQWRRGDAASADCRRQTGNRDGRCADHPSDHHDRSTVRKRHSPGRHVRHDDSQPIPMTDGRGQAGYWYAGIMGTPAQVNFGSGHAGLAVDVNCTQGGSFEFSQVWVFDGTPSNPTVAYGPITGAVVQPGHFRHRRIKHHGRPRGRELADRARGLLRTRRLQRGGHHMRAGTERDGDDDLEPVGKRSNPSRDHETAAYQDHGDRGRHCPAEINGATPDKVGLARPTGRSRSRRAESVNAVCETRRLRHCKVELDSGAWVPAADLQRRPTARL